MTKKNETKTKMETRVKVSQKILRDEEINKKAIYNQSATCIGYGDEPNSEYAEGHVSLTLVTEAQFEAAQKGRFDVRCSACENEFKSRKKNAKTVLDLRESIKKIDEVVGKKDEYGLTADQVNTLQKERSYCVGEIEKAFATPEEAAEFINQ